MLTEFCNDATHGRLIRHVCTWKLHLEHFGNSFVQLVREILFVTKIFCCEVNTNLRVFT